MLKKSTKDHSGKLAAVSAVLDQLSPDIRRDGRVPGPEKDR